MFVLAENMQRGGFHMPTDISRLGAPNAGEKRNRSVSQEMFLNKVKCGREEVICRRAVGDLAPPLPVLFPPPAPLNMASSNMASSTTWLLPPNKNAQLRQKQYPFWLRPNPQKYVHPLPTPPNQGGLLLPGVWLLVAMQEEPS